MLEISKTSYAGVGAEGGTRTPTPLRELRPERSASTSFTTSALVAISPSKISTTTPENILPATGKATAILGGESPIIRVRCRADNPANSAQAFLFRKGSGTRPALGVRRAHRYRPLESELIHPQAQDM